MPVTGFGPKGQTRNWLPPPASRCQKLRLLQFQRLFQKETPSYYILEKTEPGSHSPRVFFTLALHGASPSFQKLRTSPRPQLRVEYCSWAKVRALLPRMLVDDNVCDHRTGRWPTPSAQVLSTRQVLVFSRPFPNRLPEYIARQD